MLVWRGRRRCGERRKLGCSLSVARLRDGRFHFPGDRYPRLQTALHSNHRDTEAESKFRPTSEETGTCSAADKERSTLMWCNCGLLPFPIFMHGCRISTARRSRQVSHSCLVAGHGSGL